MKTDPQNEGPEPQDAAKIAAIAGAVLGAVMALVALVTYGPRTAASVALGSAIAVANLVTLRAIIHAIIRPPDHDAGDPAWNGDGTHASDERTAGDGATDADAGDERAEADADADAAGAPSPRAARDHRAEGKRGGAAWGVFALLKILVLFGAIWVLLTRGLVDPIPLVVGYGVLPLGIAASSLVASLFPQRADKRMPPRRRR